MTVAELIAALQKVPEQQAQVADADYNRVNAVYYDDAFKAVILKW